MKKFLVFSFLIVSVFCFGQGTPPWTIQNSPYKKGVLVAIDQFIDEGDTSYIYQHSVIDSLGLNIGADSIYMAADTIKLRDGSGYVVPGATYYITSANGQKKGDFLKPFYINENLAKNQIWNGNTWIDFDKDVFSTNELGTYFDGTITTPIQPKKGDLWFNTGISVPQLQIFTGTSWVQVEYFDQTNYTSLATDAPNNTVFIIQPNTGATPNTITTETKTPITLDYEMIDAQNWKQTIGIDTAALVNIILDSIPPPTPSADSTIVSAGHGITVTEAPSNTFTVKADTSALATNYDITLKQDNLISGTNIKTVNGNSLLGSGNVSVGTVTSVDINPSNGIGASAGPITSSGIINVWNTKPFDYIGLQAGLGNIYQLGNGQTLNITAPAPFSLTRLNGSFNLSLPAADAATDGYLKYQDWTTFNGKVGGNGVSTQAAYFNSNNTLTSNNQLFYVNSRWNMRGSFDLRYSDNNYTLAIGQGAANYPYGTGIDNVYIGRSSGRVNTSGQLNLGLGVNSLYSNTIGNSNIAIGTNSLFTNQSGNYNVAIGQSSLGATNGIDNIGIGFGAAGIIGNSNYNVAIGHTAMGIVSGDNKDYNIAIGWRSLYQSTGYNNTSIGSWAGYNAGNSNINIGYQAGFNNSGNDKLYIENTSSETPLLGGHFDSNKVGINKSINSISSTLHVGGDATIDNLAGTGTRMVVANSTGTLSTQAIPTSPQTWADFGSNMQAWNSTGTYGSGKDVGIGIQPTADLDVNGTTRLRGAIYDSGNSTGTSGQVLTSQGSGAWTWTTPSASSTNLSYSVKSGTDVTLESSTGADVILRDGAGTSVNRVASNVIKYDINTQHGELWRDGNLSAATFDNTYRVVDFSYSSNNILSSNITTDAITVSEAGTYEISYALEWQVNSATGANTAYFVVYKNGVSIGYKGQLRARQTDTGSENILALSRTFTTTLAANDYVDLRYSRTQGSDTSINIYNAVFTIKKLY